MAKEPVDPQLLEDLARPNAYPDDPTARDGIETIQTHISNLFLTRSRVVKLRKAVDLGFLDFSTRADRLADCRREVALNRRLAPDVYRGVAPVEREDGRYVVRERFGEIACEAGAPIPECAVVMRRLAEGSEALSMLDRDALTRQHLGAAARTLARFHADANLGRPAPWDEDGWWHHLFDPVAACLDSLEESPPEGLAPEELARARDTLERRFEILRPRFEERRLEGRAVDGHGDVHLQHVWFEADDAPVLIDCIEFDDELRRIDAASEVAFLAMDLRYRGRRDLGEHFLAAYAAASDDFGLYGVVDAYASYRALVRGKVAALAAADEGIGAEQRSAAAHSARRHLDLALELLQPPAAGALVLTCGTVGCGKSTVARALAERCDGVVIASDRTRKHLAGVAAAHRSDDAKDRGMYAPERRRAVYEALRERAASVVGSGRTAILDATHHERAERERMRGWARDHGVAVLLVAVGCGPEVARERLRERQAAGRDPSDAGPELLDASLADFEAPTEWPTADRFEVRTDTGGLENALEPLAARLGREGGGRSGGESTAGR